MTKKRPPTLVGSLPEWRRSTYSESHPSTDPFARQDRRASDEMTVTTHDDMNDERNAYGAGLRRMSQELSEYGSSVGYETRPVQVAIQGGMDAKRDWSRIRRT
jgi:hypothetical protein